MELISKEIFMGSSRCCCSATLKPGSDCFIVSSWKKLNLCIIIIYIMRKVNGWLAVFLFMDGIVT
jgi:hypothetical protein